MAKRKIALFGGTFDPIHLGHTAVAAAAAEHIGAEKVIFIPTKRSPLKDYFPQASGAERLKMVTLAIGDYQNFEVSDRELSQPEPSYTLTTVRQFQADYGREVSIHWLVGVDSVNELPRWYKIAELIDECNLSVMHRAGCEPPDIGKFAGIWDQKQVEKLQQNIIPTPLIDISSTEIRKRIATGKDVSNMLSPPVADYIFKHGLYRSESEP